MKKNSSLLKIIPTKLEASPVIHAASNGASEFMTNISSSLESMLFNLQLLKYLKKNGVVTYGVLMYAQFIFVAIYFGYTVGISSILITVICRFSSSYLVQLFVGYSKELLEITIKAFSLYCFTFLFFGLNTMTSAFFTALNNGKIQHVSLLFEHYYFKQHVFSYYHSCLVQMESGCLQPVQKYSHYPSLSIS